MVEIRAPAPHPCIPFLEAAAVGLWMLGQFSMSRGGWEAAGLLRTVWRKEDSSVLAIGGKSCLFSNMLSGVIFALL